MKLIRISRIAALLPLSSATAGLMGHWEFEDPSDLGKATLGADLTFTGAVSATSGPAASGAADFPKNAWAAVTNPIPANGASGVPTRTNQYSIVLDFQVPDFTDGGADSGTFTALFDFDNGGSDADYFIRKQTGATELGVGTQWPYVGAGPTANGSGTSGTVRTGTWYRLILAADTGVGRSVYLNGVLVGNYSAGTQDGARQSLSTVTPWRLLWDNDGETSRVIVANLALYDMRIDASQAAQLGTAGSPLPSFTPVVWTGAASSEWSTAAISVPKNWKRVSDGVAADFSALDAVSFDDSAVTPGIALTGGDVATASMVFSNDVLDFTISGPGTITAGSIVKSGIGKLTLAGANSYIGTTQINEGRLVLAHPLAAQGSIVSAIYGASDIVFGDVTAATLAGLGGSADLLLENPSSEAVALTLGGSGNASFSGALSGSGSLTKTGSGRQFLNFASDFTGGTTVVGGTLLAGDPAAFGTAAVVMDGGVVEFAIAAGMESTVANDFTLPGGSGPLSLFGSFGSNRTAPTPGTATRLTGKITGGSPDRIFRIGDTLIQQEHDNITILDNAGNDFTGTVELWRGTLAITSDSALGHPDNDIFLSTENLLGSLRFDADGITLNADRRLVLYNNLNPMPVNTQAFTGTIAGDISGNGNFVKQGEGTLILTGTNAATGLTTVSAGSLNVAGTFTAAGGLVTVNAGATLTGGGAIERPISAAGTLAPGAGIGTLTTGNVTLTGSLAVQIDGASSDRLEVAGDLDLTGATLALELSGGGFTQSSYVIATYTGALTGSFASVPDGYTVSYPSGQVVLQQGAASGFDAWAAAKGVAGFDADPDGDGIPNGIEFVIGGEPAPGVGSLSTGLLPQATYDAATGDLIVVFRRTSASAYLNPAVEYSTTLTGTWTSAPAGTVIGTSGDGADLVEVRLSSALASNGRIFARLKVNE